MSNTIATNKLINDLINRSDRQFEAICYELLSSFLENLLLSKSMGQPDRGGIDIFNWENETSIQNAFQCKGFEVGEFGESQLNQCKKSIDSFEKSSYKVKNYYLIINRPIINKEYRVQLEKELNNLVLTKKSKTAELLDVNKFIKFIFENLKEKIKNEINLKSEQLYRNYVDSMGQKFYYENVPFIIKNKFGEKINYDPLKYIDKKSNPEGLIKIKPSLENIELKYFFIISEFGFGKTSLMFQLFINYKKKKLIPLYIPFASFDSAGFSNTNNFCLNILKIIDIDIVNDNKLIKRIKTRVIQKFLDSDAKFILLLDGMDEHFFLKNIEGMKNFFQSIKNIAALPIISMRKEYWDSMQGNLEMSIYKNRKQDKLILIEWEQKEIVEFLQKYIKDKSFSSSEVDKLKSLLKLVSTNKYIEFYGDIPKRPLFLEMIIQDILENGVQKRNLVELYNKVLIRKLVRDITGSHQDISTNRGLSDNNDLFEINSTIEDMMIQVSEYTMKIDENEVNLENLISEKKIKNIFREYNFKESLNIYLHSVLIPSDERNYADVNLKFAHFSFLEFFFSKFILKNFSNNPFLLHYNYGKNIISFVKDLLNLKENIELKLILFQIEIKRPDSLIFSLLNDSPALKKS